MKSSASPATKTLGNWAYLAIEKHLKKILKHEADVVRDRDPEALHQMRVGMRRLRSAVTGFAPAIRLPESAGEKEIGKIARTLGQLRDLDVLKETIKDRYLPTLPTKEQKILKTALDYLEKQRRKVLKQVQKILKHKNYQRFKADLQEWLDEPTFQDMAQLPIQDVLPDILLPPVSHWFLHQGWLVGTQVEEDEIKPLQNLSHEAVEAQMTTKGHPLHDLRKETKRVRYQMELFTDFYCSKYADFLEDVKQIQEILGGIQDSFILTEFLTDALGSETDKFPPTLAQQLAETRYQMWQQWQPLQQQYLNRDTRHCCRWEILSPAKELESGNVTNGSEFIINGVAAGVEV